MPIGVFGERIAAARRDQELLLTESERRVLEDALLTQLARQIHERTVDARDLISRMNGRDAAAVGCGRASPSGCSWELSDALSDEHRGGPSRSHPRRDASGLGPAGLAPVRGALRRPSIKDGPRRPNRTAPTATCSARCSTTDAGARSRSSCTRPGGGEERLTRARHGTALRRRAVGVPAPAAVRGSAFADIRLGGTGPHPRLLALDEAFAGVDDKGRTKTVRVGRRVRLRPDHDWLRPVGHLRHRSGGRALRPVALPRRACGERPAHGVGRTGHGRRRRRRPGASLAIRRRRAAGRGEARACSTSSTRRWTPS